MITDTGLIEKALSLEGDVIIKAAGNMAKKILFIAKSKGLPFKVIAGAGADKRTILGAAKHHNMDVVVQIPRGIQ